MHLELQNGLFDLSTDPARLDVEAIYAFLSHSYWAMARPRAMIEKSIRNSLCFGIYHSQSQIGFARVVTDCATFGYLADVYILEPYRGQGLGHWLIETILSHPELKELRRWSLATRDAHPLYRQFGFQPLERPQDFMELVRPYSAAVL
jgi:GNAT superfamily N-acetyltransferase